MIVKTFYSIAALVAVTVGMPFNGVAETASVMFEAESGTLGSDFAVSNGTPTYITIKTVLLGETPVITSRVGTFSVTFPSAGTYNLFGRVRVGPGASYDSFFYGNGFGPKSATADADWITVDGVAGAGFTNSSDVVSGAGSAGTNVWKWINFSSYTGSSGEPPVTFTVTAATTNQTFQIAGRERAFNIDKLVFGKVGYPFTVANLEAGTTPEPPGRVSVPAFLSNGDLTISYIGLSDHKYAAEWAEDLIPPVTWTPLLTNTADVSGLVSFTNTPAGSQTFYRVHDVTTPPLVYAVENTGAGFPPPPLPTEANLPIIIPLTDPFMWSAASPTNWFYPTGRSTNFVDWSHRRAEIKAEIENYEIGIKPAVDSQNIFASYVGGVLTVIVTNIVSGTPRTLTLACVVSFPAGTGPFPAIIGMNSPNGGISLGGRPIATITYSHDQVTTYNNPQNTDPYYQLYANLGLDIDNTGQYSAWAWGVSRIIDGLYKVQGTLPINLERIGVTGCSYAGKMALFAGALDERIALTIPQESGGGGAPNWRYSYQMEAAGSVEGLAQTSHQWFKESMFDFADADTAKLPHDHHELMMMVAPRALFATGNPDGAAWLSNPSCYVSCKAVEVVYDAFGISDRFGYNIEGGKSHCATTASLNADVGAFLDKFLLGNTNVNTVTNRHVPGSYSSIDHARWYAWWGTTNPTFSGAAPATYTNTYEPECATVGSAWQISTDAAASNGKYVTVTPGIQSVSSAPAGASNLVVIPVSVATAGNAAVFGRVNCPTADDDSFWVQMDGGPFTMLNGLVTSGWQWVNLGTFSLTSGSHTFTIGYREDGAQLDKISISDYSFAPSGLGPAAALLCP